MNMTTADPIVILSYARTPMGSFQGALAGAAATELGAAAVRAAVERSGISGEEVDKIFMGCVLPAGLGQAPARQAEYAIESLRRATEAIRSGAFEREIVPVTVKSRKGEDVVAIDEQPGKSNPEKIPGLKPAFAKDGTITAANASSISDGAAALVITRASVAERLGVKPVARIVAHAAHAQEPSKFTSAPVPAVQKALDRAGWSASDV